MISQNNQAPAGTKGGSYDRNTRRKKRYLTKNTGFNRPVFFDLIRPFETPDTVKQK